MGVLSGALSLREYRDRPWIATTQIFVSALPVSTGTGAGVTSYEAESRQIAQDFAQVLSGRLIAENVGSNPMLIRSHATPAAIQSAISSSASGRVLSFDVSTPSSGESLAIASVARDLLLRSPGRYVGAFEAGRTQMTVISPPVIHRTSGGQLVLMLTIRLIVGAIVAFALALLWDYVGRPASS